MRSFAVSVLWVTPTAFGGCADGPPFEGGDDGDQMSVDTGESSSSGTQKGREICVREVTRTVALRACDDHEPGCGRRASPFRT